MSTVEQDVDLSSFPLLRIDQTHRHDTQTLVAAEAQLALLEREAAMNSITPFVSKLLARIRGELANRAGGDESKPTEDGQGDLPRSASNGATAKPPRAMDRTPSRPRKQPHRSQTKSHAVPQPSFFVSSSPKSKSSNFRSRAKLAKASLQARSDEAISRQREQERHERARQALATMQDRRTEREKSKKRREELLEEEREQRRRRWKERREREEGMHSSMQAAAEEARSMALEAGHTHEEAIVEAAAAAARVVDDASTDLNCTNADSEEGSYIDDSTIEESLASNIGVCDKVASSDSDESTPEQPPANDSSFDTSSSQVLVSEDCHDPNAPCAGCDIAAGAALSPWIDAATSLTDTGIDSTNNETIHERAEETDLPVKVIELPDQSLSDRQNLDVEGDGSIQSRLDGEAPPDDVSTTRDEGHKDASEVETNVDYAELDQSTSETSSSRSSVRESIVEKVTREASKPTAIKAGVGRKRDNSFPPFSDIFVRPSGGTSEKASSDHRQRELAKLMQHQIAQYAQSSKAFAALNEPCSESEEDSSSDDDSSGPSSAFDRGLFYRINSRRPEVASIIHKAFSSQALSSWKELPPEIEQRCWNLMWVWGMPKASDFDNLLAFQKISRFRNTRGLTRKDLLKKNIQRCSKASARDGDSFNIMPLTYALPHEFNSFVSGYQSIQKNGGNKAPNLWILKPVGLSRGRGISLVDDIADVSYSQPIVIQRYIADPLCFMGYKFDLRMYVLVTSFSPLEAFIYKEGLARFGSRQYSLRSEFLHDHRIHLTNSSIQREYGDSSINRSHPAYLAGSNGSGNKVAFSWLFSKLEGLGMDTERLWQKMVDVCRKALAAAGSDITHQPNSFELFGFDLMFDQRLKCWLIEVNSSPSLGCDSPLDARIKGALIRETIELVDPLAYDRKALADVCTRRLTHRKSASGASSEDVARILRNKPPRQFGQMPNRGGFERMNLI